MIQFRGRGTPGRTRLAALVSVTGLLAGLLVVLTPGPASAGAVVPCPAGITEWRLIASSSWPPLSLWEGYRYTLGSAIPQFLVSDGRALDNGTDSPVTFTIMSSVSRTHRVAATVGVSANNVLEFLNANVSTTIESSRTTAIGVTLSTTVPPRTRLLAEYGVDVFQVSYTIEAWRAVTPRNAGPPPVGYRCEEWGIFPQSTVAPTPVETWRLRTG